jgi:hypothetical protein
MFAGMSRLIDFWFESLFSRKKRLIACDMDDVISSLIVQFSFLDVAFMSGKLRASPTETIFLPVRLSRFPSWM